MQISVNGVSLYYEVSGHGRPLILLHGNGEDHTIFREAAQALSGTFTCYMPDTRGHGKSSPVASYRYTDMAVDLIAMIRQLKLDRPVVYGFSDGGIVGLLAAVMEPELLSRLIISGANTHPLGVKFSFWVSMFFGNLVHPDPLLRLMLYQPRITAKQLRGISVPVCVLAGEHDLIRRAHTRRIARLIPGASLRIVMHEDHGSYIVHSRRIAELITECCGRNGTSAACRTQE